MKTFVGIGQKPRYLTDAFGFEDEECAAEKVSHRVNRHLILRGATDCHPRATTCKKGGELKHEKSGLPA
jgi:hypothetical protein